ncbi:hypothetical protein AZK38_08145, partial [Streptococcus pneumoniae]
MGFSKCLKHPYKHDQKNPKTIDIKNNNLRFFFIFILLVIYNHGDISIPSFIRYHLTIARFSRTIES